MDVCLTDHTALYTMYGFIIGTCTAAHVDLPIGQAFESPAQEVRPCKASPRLANFSAPDRIGGLYLVWMKLLYCSKQLLLFKIP